jgi:aryl sulfotransferase
VAGAALVRYWGYGESGVTGTIWLASYPKSGNTWMRILIGNLWAKAGDPTGLDRLIPCGIASARNRFDLIMLIDSGLLTHDEIDGLRPRAYEALARGELDDQIVRLEEPIRFVKVHDAYTMNLAGEPLLGGSAGADGAIVIVRDPRDIAPSLAHHMNFSIDDAIAFMHDDDATFCKKTSALYPQLRQRLRGWSEHVASWLDQTDIPVHLIRYEDLRQDTAGTLSRISAFAGLPVTEEKINQAVACSDFALLREQEERNGFREAPRWPEARFFRRGEVGAWRDELTREQVIRIESRHEQMMLRLGYEPSCISSLARAG